MKIAKPGGGTPTERLLSTLCEKTFLKLWTWANPRQDDGKELCDLLAIFDNHIFIFFLIAKARLYGIPEETFALHDHVGRRRQLTSR